MQTFTLDRELGPPVFVIDPGKASGWVLDPGDGRVLAGIDARNETLERLAAFLGGSAPPVHVVMETFRVSERTIRTKPDTSALEIIGAAKYLATLHGGTVIMQTPADAKGLVPDARLRTLGLWYPGREDHARDALRHYVRYLAVRQFVTLTPLETT